MAEPWAGDPEVGMRVQMTGTGRTGTIREVLKTRGRAVYYIVHDAIPEEAVTVPGELAATFATYCTPDTFDVLPS